MIALPKDLLARGFHLIAVAPGELFAVSECWGCTGVKAQLADVVREARSLIAYIQWRERQAMPPAPPQGDIFPIGKHNTSIETADDTAAD